jgi:3-methylcrotonyl-CoA carboxylase alpha subunit
VRLGSGSEDEIVDGALRAPMPGTVVSIDAVPGQVVRKGDVLAMMTAMKIEIALAAPFDGVVSRVDSQVGDLVSTHHALVTIVPTAGDEQ